MDNKDFINAYKSEDKILTDYYKISTNGKKIELDRIVCPLKVDNRQLMSPTDNQKDTPHCAGYSAATLVESTYWKHTGKLLQLDSHQVYALSKQLDGQTYMEGTYLEAALNAVLKLCRNDDKFSFLKDAKIETFFNDKTDKTIWNAKHLIHKHDFLQVGFNIDEGWYDCSQVNYVLKARGRNLGGHAVNLCGYDSEGFYILNQWGTSFGSKGYVIMPYDLFLKQFMYGAYLTNIKQ